MQDDTHHAVHSFKKGAASCFELPTAGSVVDSTAYLLSELSVPGESN